MSFFLDWCTSCFGKQQSYISCFGKQQSYISWLVHLRQVHPLKVVVRVN